MSTAKTIPPASSRDQWRTLFQLLASHPGFLFRREHRRMLARIIRRLAAELRARR